MPVITRDPPGHNARRWSGIIGAGGGVKMKVKNRAFASQNNALFVSQGSRAQGLTVRPCPHSNGLKRTVPPHCVTSSRNKTVWALRFVLGNEPSQPQPRGLSQGRGTKRKAHTALLRELATQWGGTAGFNPLLCGQGRSIKPCAREPWETNNALL